MQPAMTATIRALITRVTQGLFGDAFAQIAQRHDALPLAEGWFAWALLTENGEVFEAAEDGTVSAAEEPLRTMFLVAGSERFPELSALLPVRSATCTDCATCEGTGRMKFGTGKVRCGHCRSLGWVEASPG